MGLKLSKDRFVFNMSSVKNIETLKQIWDVKCNFFPSCTDFPGINSHGNALNYCVGAALVWQSIRSSCSCGTPPSDSEWTRPSCGCSILGVNAGPAFDAVWQSAPSSWEPSWPSTATSPRQRGRNTSGITTRNWTLLWHWLGIESKVTRSSTCVKIAKVV